MSEGSSETQSYAFDKRIKIRFKDIFQGVWNQISENQLLNMTDGLLETYYKMLSEKPLTAIRWWFKLKLQQEN